MKIVVTIQHASHVHFFKHAIDELESQDHDVHVFARDNESSTTLLDYCGIEYELLAGSSDSLPSLAVAQLIYETRLLQRARRIDPDVMMAIGGVAVAHVAPLVGARSIVFYDTEHATLIRNMAFPFADTVTTPECFEDDVGEKQVRYPGYHELAYLHPNRFEPDTDVLDEAGVDPDDTLALVRLGDWGSSHDVGHSGVEDPYEIVDALESAGARVRITSETDLPPGLEGYRLSLSPDRFHDLLYYADLYVGEGATTAAESAVLGTPAVYVSSLPLGYLSELESEYGLAVNCTGSDRRREAIEAAVSILERAGSDEWERKRERLLADRVDGTDVILNQVAATAEE